MLVSVLLLCSVAMALSFYNEKSYFVRQEPQMLLLNPGATAIINCTVTSDYNINVMYLRKRFKIIMTMTADSFKIQPEYKNRLTLAGRAPHYFITLKNLTEDDSDFYLCDGMVGDFEQVHGEGTLLFVEKPEEIKKQNQAEQSQWPTYIIPTIIVAVACLLFFLAILVYVRYKTLEKRKKENRDTYMDTTQNPTQSADKEEQPFASHVKAEETEKIMAHNETI